MFSIADVFNEAEIVAFDERIRKEFPNPSYVCELKIDGLAVSLTYEKGSLKVLQLEETEQLGKISPIT